MEGERGGVVRLIVVKSAAEEGRDVLLVSGLRVVSLWVVHGVCRCRMRSAGLASAGKGRDEGGEGGKGEDERDYLRHSATTTASHVVSGNYHIWYQTLVGLSTLMLERLSAWPTGPKSIQSTMSYASPQH